MAAEGHISSYCTCPLVRDPLGTPVVGEGGKGLRDHRPGCKPRWQFMHDAPRGHGGKRKQINRKGFRTKKEAQRALRESQTSLDTGLRPDSTRRTVGEYLDQWIAGKASLRETTRTSYESHIRLYLTPHLGHVRLVDLRHHHIEAMFNDLRARDVKPLMPRTLQRIKATLNSALNDAVRRRLIPFNPTATVELPSASTRRQHTWTPQQLAHFLRVAESDRLGAAFRLAGYTGMRRGELAGLRWSDVDLDAGWVRVANQRVEVHGGTSDAPPKTKSGERVIPLDPGTVARMLDHRHAWELERMVFAEQAHDRSSPALRGARSVPSCSTDDCRSWRCRRACRKSGCTTCGTRTPHMRSRPGSP